MFKFEWWYLALFVFLPIIIRYFFSSALKTETDALKVPFYQDILNIKSGREKLKQGINLNYIALILIWILVVLAAMRPQFSYDPMLINPKGRVLMTAIDISGSMSLKDMMIESKKIDRLEAVKNIYTNFLENRKGDRVGLVVFGTKAFLLAPPTFDRNSVITALNEASTGMAGSKTAIGDGLGLAIKYMEKIEEEKRVLILLSDGASNAGNLNIEQAINLAKQANVKIYTIAFGKDTMETQIGPLKMVVDISSQIDTASLQKIAEVTDGKFYRAKDADSLKEYYEEINKIEPSAKNEIFLEPVRELYYLPLSLALLILIIFILTNLYALKRQKYANN